MAKFILPTLRSYLNNFEAMKSNEKILIEPETRISQLLKRFDNAFPFLRMEIYKKGEIVGFDQRDFKLMDIANIKKNNKFMINGDLKVSEVEELFMTNSGLQVVIFRKMGTSEVETTFTSQWTLNHQNDVGQEIQQAI